MPELPEVEAVTRRLRRMALGARIVGAGMYRKGSTAPQDPGRLKRGVKGRVIESIERRGKNIVLGLDGGSAVRIHLRMTGNLTVIPDYRLKPAMARVWFELEDGRALILHDPRALGRVTLHNREELEELFGELGPEPFSREFTVRVLRRTGKAVAEASEVVVDGTEGSRWAGKHLRSGSAVPGRYTSGPAGPANRRREAGCFAWRDC